jgi:hypothetical protein
MPAAFCCRRWICIGQITVFSYSCAGSNNVEPETIGDKQGLPLLRKSDRGRAARETRTYAWRRFNHIERRLPRVIISTRGFAVLHGVNTPYYTFASRD